MVARSVASSALVEAYLNSSLSPPEQQHASAPSQLPAHIPAFSSRLAANAAVRELAGGASSRSTASREVCPPLHQMLKGTWVPPPRHSLTPRQNDKIIAQREQASKRIMADLDMANHLELAGVAGMACEPQSRRTEGRACSSNGRCSSYSGSQTGGGGSVAGESECNNSQALSHATTPSWRSRSFPPRFARERIVQANRTLQKPRLTQKPRLPPLPIEARWFAATQLRGAPPSEVQRLHDIDAHVNEANAMLVESFLNVKRHPPENMPTLSVIESGCGSWDGSQIA